jgi:hypothetical protein
VFLSSCEATATVKWNWPLVYNFRLCVLALRGAQTYTRVERAGKTLGRGEQNDRVSERSEDRAQVYSM